MHVNLQTHTSVDTINCPRISRLTTVEAVEIISTNLFLLFLNSEDKTHKPLSDLVAVHNYFENL